MTVEELLNQYLAEFGVEVKFSRRASEDLAFYDKNIQEKIIALILKRGQAGPLIKPKGSGTPLGKELSGFTKIKPRSLNLRIIYRPVELSGVVRMEIMAIGPRDKEKVYQMAVARLLEFKKEMDK
ncbi:MAG: hypothetical protein AB1796_06075 [Bacillota bacterium]